MKPREPRRLRQGEKQPVYGAFTTGRARKKLPAAKHPLLRLEPIFGRISNNLTRFVRPVHQAS